MNVKINNQNYVVPDFKFSDFTKIEDYGFSLFNLIQKQNLFSIATAFVIIVAECDREEAERLCEQHILGGGDLSDFISKFNDGVEKAGFIKKMLMGSEEKQSTEK